MASGGSPDATSQAACASDARLQRGIPSFKLMDDERARTKRFRNRVPSAGGRVDIGSSEGDVGEVPTMSTLLFQDTRTPPQHPAAGPRRVSSFTLSNDVFRSMSHASSWGSGAGGNMFGFGSASVDGEGEDAVQRLDDASFNDLNFLTMEGVGPSDPAGTPQREPSEAGLDTKLLENRAAAFEGGLDRYAVGNGGSTLQATVPKEEAAVNAIVGRAGSARDSLSTTSSSRDMLGSTASMVSRKDSGILGSNVFDLGGGLPTFSASMEEYLNRQLEAAEQSLDHSAGGGGHTDEEESSTPMGVVREAGSSPPLGATRSVVVKSERDSYLGSAGEIPRDGASPQYVQVKGETYKPGMPKRRTRKGRSSQYKQQRQEHGSDEEAGSSHSEYEPPTPRGGKAKKGRGRGRAATATATRAAKASSSLPAARAAGLPGAVFRRSLKRQTSEDVAARLPLEVLECFYHVPLNVAAQQLSVSLTMLKKLCRAYGVKRWPHRQVSSLDKTTSRLEEKIKARKDDGKDAPSLDRKLTQARKRRSVIIKTASAGLDAAVLNSIFTCRPGDIDEDFLLASNDVAKAVEKIKFNSEVVHKNADTGSESDDDSDDDDDEDDEDGSDGSDENEDEEEPQGTAVKQSPVTTKKKTCVGDVLAAPPFASSKPTAVVKSVSAPPPAFEPGGRMKSAAPKTSDTKTGNKPGVKPGVKTERLATPARRTRKVAAPSTKGRKGVAAGRQPVPSASNAAVSVLATHGQAGASPGSNISDGSGLDDSACSLALTAADAMLASSPVFPFGISSAARSRAPMTGYSGVFGTGLHHRPSSAPGRGKRPQAPAGKKSAGDPFGRTPAAAAQLRGGEGAPHVQQAAQVPVWVGAGGKRAMGYGEWRGGMPSSQSSPLQQQLSDSRSDSPTTTATLDSFNLKLSLESPTRGSTALPPPPPPPHHGHPYMLHHQLTHHQQACFNSTNWVGGRYQGQPQQPYGFPMELMSPVDTHFPHQRHGSGSQEFHAFSNVDDTSEAYASNNAACGAGDAAEACASGEGVPAKAAAESVSEDPAPRRTGFMSYLLHQRPQSPPLDPCLSPPAPPTAPSAVGALDADL